MVQGVFELADYPRKSLTLARSLSLLHTHSTEGQHTQARTHPRMRRSPRLKLPLRLHEEMAGNKLSSLSTDTLLRNFPNLLSPATPASPTHTPLFLPRVFHSCCHSHRNINPTQPSVYSFLTLFSTSPIPLSSSTCPAGGRPLLARDR